MVPRVGGVLQISLFGTLSEGIRWALIYAPITPQSEAQQETLPFGPVQLCRIASEGKEVGFLLGPAHISLRSTNRIPGLSSVDGPSELIPQLTLLELAYEHGAHHYSCDMLASGAATNCAFLLVPLDWCEYQKHSCSRNVRSSGFVVPTLDLKAKSLNYIRNIHKYISAAAGQTGRRTASHTRDAGREKLR